MRKNKIVKNCNNSLLPAPKGAAAHSLGTTGVGVISPALCLYLSISLCLSLSLYLFLFLSFSVYVCVCLSVSFSLSLKA